MKKITTFLLTCIFISLSSQSIAQGHDHGHGHPSDGPKPLQQGKWIGTVTLEGQSSFLAAQLDIFLTQPINLRDFPRLESIFKLSLGGFQGLEHDVVHYDEIQYSYTTGQLNLDSPESDWIIRAQVVEPGMIHGTVASNLGGKRGTLHLVHADHTPSSEPCDPEEEECPPEHNPVEGLPQKGYLPTLGGTYSGTCEGTDVTLELIVAQTVEEEFSTSDLLKDYHIEGRLGTPGQCGTDSQGNPAPCVTRVFHNGEFSFFNQALTLFSDTGTETCTYGDQGQLACTLHLAGESKSCQLQPQKRPLRTYAPGKKEFTLPVNQENRQPLTVLSPETLRAELQGDFAGYLFHQQRGVYQPMAVSLVSSTSTENPHNVDDSYISGSIRLHLGPNTQHPALTYKLDRRTFYLSDGFTLRGEESDIMLVIKDWRKGMITGTAYAKSFGRIGLFELRKTTELPPLPASALPFPELATHYVEVGSNQSLPWNLQLKPVSATNIVENMVTLNGRAMLAAPGMPIPPFRMESGSYDLYSGALALQIKSSEAASRWFIGEVTPTGSISAWLSATSSWGVKMDTGDKRTLVKPE